MIDVNHFGSSKEFPVLVNLTDIINKLDDRERDKCVSRLSRLHQRHRLQVHAIRKSCREAVSIETRKQLYEILKKAYIETLEYVELPKLVKSHYLNFINAYYKKLLHP